MNVLEIPLFSAHLHGNLIFCLAALLLVHTRQFNRAKPLSCYMRKEHDEHIKHMLFCGVAKVP